MTVAEAQARIDAIDEILASGISSTTIGDKRIDRDLDALRQERTYLERIMSSASSAPKVRRVVFRGRI